MAEWIRQLISGSDATWIAVRIPVLARDGKTEREREMRLSSSVKVFELTTASGDIKQCSRQIIAGNNQLSTVV